MNLDEAINILRAYVKIDRESRNFAVESEFEQFCELECKATEIVLDWVLAERSKLNK